MAWHLSLLLALIEREPGLTLRASRDAGRASGFYQSSLTMHILAPVVAVSPPRQRLIDEMEMRRFGRETLRN